MQKVVVACEVYKEGNNPERQKKRSAIGHNVESAGRKTAGKPQKKEERKKKRKKKEKGKTTLPGREVYTRRLVMIISTEGADRLCVRGHVHRA